VAVSIAAKNKDFSAKFPTIKISKDTERGPWWTLPVAIRGAAARN